jgi:hypothetical protein
LASVRGLREVEDTESLALGHHGDAEVTWRGRLVEMFTEEADAGIFDMVDAAAAETPALIGSEDTFSERGGSPDGDGFDEVARRSDDIEGAG